MDKEKIIQELVEISKSKGYLAVKEILKFVSDDSEEFDIIVAELEKKQVDVVSEEEMINYKVPDVSEDNLIPVVDEELDESIVLDLDFSKDIEEELLHDKSFENQISIKVDDPVRMYLKEIGRVDLLEGTKEVELATDIANAELAKEQFDELVLSGDEISPEYKLEIERMIYKGELAKNKLVEANLRLVVSIAKRYVGRGMQFLDLIQEGNMGLMKAVGKFDHTKGFKFSTYATWWIRQSIERALVNQSRTIRLPVHIAENMNRMLKATRESLKQLNREPSDADIADVMGSNVEEVRRLQLLLRKTYSIEHPLGDDEGYSLMNTLEDTSVVTPTDLIENKDNFLYVTQWLDQLKDNEREILTLRFGLDDREPETLETIGKRFGVTRERIRQIEVKSLEKLRTIMRNESEN